MKKVIIATNLKDDSTNVEIENLVELERFVKFAGGDDKVYFWSPFNEWITILEWSQSNPIENIF